MKNELLRELRGLAETLASAEILMEDAYGTNESLLGGPLRTELTAEQATALAELEGEADEAMTAISTARKTLKKILPKEGRSVS